MFSLESDNLPSYVKKQPLEVAKKWIELFNQYFTSDDEAMAWALANAWLKRVIEFNRKQTESVAEEQSLEVIDVKFESEEEEIVIRAEGDEEYVDFILADLKRDKYDTTYTEEFLTELAEQINKSGIEGDFNHELQYQLKEAGYGKEAIKEMMEKKKGIAKTVKAIVDAGKLFIRTTVDKRYRNRIMNSKGVSIEGAFYKNKETNKFVGGKIFGFSFIDSPNLEPGNPRAVRV